MNDKRIVTIQDISCVGQCSLTVALPILSACGLETAVMPSAILSTHTGGFSGYTFRDLTEDMPLIAAHWQDEGLQFDAVYTGYLGSIRQIDIVLSILDSLEKPDKTIFIDPAMADNGKLYAGFDMAYAQAMEQLCEQADFLLPNITEACLLTGETYRETYGEDYIDGLLAKLGARFSGTVILTGVGYRPSETGVVLYRNGEKQYYAHPKLPKGCHGTGDIFASSFVGAVLRGFTPYNGIKIAADYTRWCIEETQKDPDHWYGAKFEPVLPRLIQALYQPETGGNHA